VAGEGGASIEPRVPTSGALRKEGATVAAIREALACEGEVEAPIQWASDTTDGQQVSEGYYC
jgi:hypothetical protein